MAQLSIMLLGGFDVTLDGKPVTYFASNKVRALLAYLATETDRAHSREKLAALLWPDMPDKEARNNLRYALSNLRKSINDLNSIKPVLCISWQTIQLNLDRGRRGRRPNLRAVLLASGAVNVQPIEPRKSCQPVPRRFPGGVLLAIWRRWR